MFSQIVQRTCLLLPCGFYVQHPDKANGVLRGDIVRAGKIRSNVKTCTEIVDLSRKAIVLPICGTHLGIENGWKARAHDVCRDMVQLLCNDIPDLSVVAEDIPIHSCQSFRPGAAFPTVEICGISTGPWIDLVKMNVYIAQTLGQARKLHALKFHKPTYCRPRSSGESKALAAWSGTGRAQSAINAFFHFCNLTSDLCNGFPTPASCCRSAHRAECDRRLPRRACPRVCC